MPARSSNVHGAGSRPTSQASTISPPSTTTASRMTVVRGSTGSGSSVGSFGSGCCGSSIARLFQSVANGGVSLLVRHQSVRSSTRGLTPPFAALGNNIRRVGTARHPLPEPGDVSPLAALGQVQLPAGPGHLWIETKRLRKVGNRGNEIALQTKGRTPRPIGEGRARLETNGLRRVGDGAVKLALHPMGRGSRRAGGRTARVQTDRFRGVGKRLVDILLLQVRHGALLVLLRGPRGRRLGRRGALWLLRDGGCRVGRRSEGRQDAKDRLEAEVALLQPRLGTAIQQFAQPLRDGRPLTA